MGDAHWGRDRKRRNKKERPRWFFPEQNHFSPFLRRLECLPDTHWDKEDPIAAFMLGPPLGT